MLDADLLLSLYAGITSDQALGDFLARLANRFDCCSAALFYVDRKRPAATFRLAHGRLAEASVQALYVGRYAALDPAPRAMARLAVGEVASTDQLFTGKALIQHREFLEGFYHAVGLGGALGGPLVRDGGRVGMVAVQRGLERVRFGEEDVERFRALVPFVIQALDLRRRFFDSDAALLRLEAALAPVMVGVMAFDEEGVLRHANPAARAVLARRDALTIDPVGRLQAVHPAAEKALKACFAQVDKDGRYRPVAIAREQLDLPSYVVRVSSQRTQLHEESAGGFTVLISDAGRAEGDAAYLLGVAFSLSPEAAQLVAALVAGENLAGHAARAGISVNTAKYHLKMAFAATNTRRQVDLVRTAVALLRDLG